MPSGNQTWLAVYYNPRKNWGEWATHLKNMGILYCPIFDYRRVMMIEQWIWGGNYISYTTLFGHTKSLVLQRSLNLDPIFAKLGIAFASFFGELQADTLEVKPVSHRFLYPACPLEVRQKKDANAMPSFANVTSATATIPQRGTHPIEPRPNSLVHPLP